MSEQEQGISGIYTIINTITGEAYIGSSVDMQHRMGSHRTLLRLGKHHCKLFQEAWDDFGEDAFRYEVLEVVPDRHALARIEQRYLDERKPRYNAAKIAIDRASENNPYAGDEMTAGSNKVRAMLHAEIFFRLNPQIQIGEFESDGAIHSQNPFVRLYEKIDYLTAIANTLDTNMQILLLMSEKGETGLTESEQKEFYRAANGFGNALLAELVTSAGVVTPKDFAIFTDHGYRGLYGGETARDIAARKDVRPGKILDHMGSSELAANWFRITQTRDKIEREAIDTRDRANAAHEDVGKVVRQAIEDMGGTLPENLPTPDTSIQQVQRAEQRRLTQGMDLFPDDETH